MHRITGGEVVLEVHYCNYLKEDIVVFAKANNASIEHERPHIGLQQVRFHARRTAPKKKQACKQYQRKTN